MCLSMKHILQLTPMLREKRSIDHTTGGELGRKESTVTTWGIC